MNKKSEIYRKKTDGPEVIIYIHTGQAEDSLCGEMKAMLGYVKPLLEAVSAQQERTFTLHLWQKAGQLYLEAGYATNENGDDGILSSAIIVMYLNRMEHTIPWALYNDNPFWQPLTQEAVKDMCAELARSYGYSCRAPRPLDQRVKDRINGGTLLVLNSKGERVRPDLQFTLIREDGSLFDRSIDAFRNIDPS